MRDKQWPTDTVIEYIERKAEWLDARVKLLDKEGYCEWYGNKAGIECGKMDVGIHDRTEGGGDDAAMMRIAARVVEALEAEADAKEEAKATAKKEG